MFMMPCPLCILQRVAFAGMGVFFLFGAITGSNPRWLRRTWAVLVGLFAAAGAGIAIWHIRMQYLPPSEVPTCSGMDISYMLEAFPLQKVVEKVFTGSGECAKIDWTFLGLSMPTWPPGTWFSAWPRSGRDSANVPDVTVAPRPWRGMMR